MPSSSPSFKLTSFAPVLGEKGMLFVHRCCGLIVLGVLLSSCHSKNLAMECPHDVGFRTEYQWLDAVQLPYVALEPRRARILENFDRIAVGSSKNQVVAALGEPDYEKEIRPKNSKRSCDYAFLYYFEKPSAAVNVIHDIQIEIYFSANGKAFWIVSNIPGLAERGGPSEDDSAAR